MAESTIGGLECVVILQYIQGPGAAPHNVPDAVPHKVPGAAPHSAAQRRTAPHKVPGAALPMYELLYWRERQDHRNVFGDQRDYLIAQFSSVNIYNSNTPLVAYLSVGYWIAITSYRVIVVHPMGASTEV